MADRWMLDNCCTEVEQVLRVCHGHAILRLVAPLNLPLTGPLPALKPLGPILASSQEPTEAETETEQKTREHSTSRL